MSGGAVGVLHVTVTTGACVGVWLQVPVGPLVCQRLWLLAPGPPRRPEPSQSLRVYTDHPSSTPTLTLLSLSTTHSSGESGPSIPPVFPSHVQMSIPLRPPPLSCPSHDFPPSLLTFAGPSIL